MIERDPIARFRDRMARARRAGEPDATANVVATAVDGRPSARYVLLKEVDEGGFVFYTNHNSRKAEALRANPHAALCFPWPRIGTEVQVAGPVEPVAPEEADAYFRTRPRVSQLGAWASIQSAPMRTPFSLFARVALQAVRFFGRPVRRPPFWSGFRVCPDRIAFIEEEAGVRERRVYLRGRGEWTLAERTFALTDGPAAREPAAAGS